jgi:23S rRNA (cytosine1962-C5)-methyltransferase
LFLDLRAGRRWLKANAGGKSVLNLFAYTCGAGVAAAVGGAGEVWNVDFAKSYLEFGRENAALNGIGGAQFQLIQSDCFPAMWQLAGLPVKQRMRRLPNGRRVPRKMPEYPKLSARQFDLTILDPPRWAKSPFATVDLIRDYQSLFKPALLSTREDGEILACNNVAKVELEAWLESLVRCGTKAGREVEVREVLQPEIDFPSFDGRHPLKMAVLQV